jgi:MoaA/NifB/PqqE/SkfB family radical SAM enzyme
VLTHFKRVVDEIPNLEKVTLQGLGEPLLAPDLFRMIEYAARAASTWVSIRMGRS